jgi:hypothetical protein
MNNLFTNMLLKSWASRTSLVIPQIKTMHDKTSDICTMYKVIIATSWLPVLLDTQTIKGNATLSEQTMMLIVLSLQLCVSSDSFLAVSSIW